MKNKKKVYIVGIAGIGMSALAGLFAEANWHVEGSDSAFLPPASTVLEEIGATLHRGYSEKNVIDADLYVVGNAVNRENPEVNKILHTGKELLSLPSALNKLFLSNKKVILITGTHGKTTTTGAVWWLLKNCGFSCGLFVGGILKNTGKSYANGNDFFVVEGDEYPTSFMDKKPKFLHYKADLLILNSLEFDHADVYRNMEEVEKAFLELLDLNRTAKIFASAEWESIRNLLKKAGIQPVWYGKGPHSAVIPQSHGPLFSFITERGKLEFENPYLFGPHMASNLAGTIAVGISLGISLEKIGDTLKKYKGMVRRSEVVFNNGEIVIIDDFAHHPTEVKVTISSIRERFKKRIVAVFEPRTNTSRRKVFHKEYIDALSRADCVYLLPLYKEEGIKEEERLPLMDISRELKRKGKKGTILTGYDDIGPLVEEAKEEGVFVFMSSGNMGGMPEELANRLK